MKRQRENNGEIEVVRLCTPDDAEALLRIFEQIAAGEGWQPGNQLRTYLENSLHFAVKVGGELAGGLQFVLPDTEGNLPCHAVWPELDTTAQGPVVHVTIMALRPEFRGRPHLFWPLCVELWRFCIAEGIDTVVLEVTPPMLERYRRVGFPLEVIGELRLHWGEPCCLCKIDICTVAGTLLMRAPRSPIYRALVVQAMRSLTYTGCTPAPALP